MTIYITAVVEGLTDESVITKLLKYIGRFELVSVMGKNGKSYVEKKLDSLNKAAQGSPFVILLDLDNNECAPSYIRTVLPESIHPNLVLRIAVREVESWLIADRKNLATFLGVAETKLPAYADDVENPKLAIVKAARSSRKAEIQQDIVPPDGSSAKVGQSYVLQINRFVMEKWDIEKARSNSPSLERAIQALIKFESH